MAAWTALEPVPTAGPRPGTASGWSWASRGPGATGAARRRLRARDGRRGGGGRGAADGGAPSAAAARVSQCRDDHVQGRRRAPADPAGIALYVAHTNADVATPGVSDALAAAVGLRDVRPLSPRRATRAGSGRCPTAAAGRARRRRGRRCPATTSGCGRPATPARSSPRGRRGRGRRRLPGDVAAAGVDAFLTADSAPPPGQRTSGRRGPALLEAPHWATERPWLDALAAELRTDLPRAVVSDSSPTCGPCIAGHTDHRP
jgi:putative NIF3 family GTP cyclohydrolase 1 type 2